MKYLISPNELMQQLNSTDSVVVFDCRFSLMDADAGKRIIWKVIFQALFMRI